MAVLQWKRFLFFDRVQVQDPDTRQPYTGLKDLSVVSATSGRGLLVFGDAQGTVHFLDRALNLSSFRAFSSRLTHVHQTTQQSVLLAIGYDEDGSVPLLRVWRRDPDRPADPKCLRTVRIQPGTRAPGQVTCLAVGEDPGRVAVGLDDGTVVLLTGDLARDRTIGQRVVHEDKQPITGLGFKDSSTRGRLLFIATPGGVFLCAVEAKRPQSELLDEQGAGLRCSVMSDKGDLVLGRSECVFFYEESGRGPCYVFDGEKRLLQWFRHYLLIVSVPRQQRGAAAGDLVSIYDMTSRCVAYAGPVPAVAEVLCEWGSVFLLTADNQLYQLVEKDTQSKLDTLFRKHLYGLALGLAKGAHYDAAQIAEIHTAYGDHLYAKADYDGAMQQYVRTIGRLEASYVLRKFLDAQRIHNLTAYLQALHEHPQATALVSPDHTTLLLNCYTKLRDTTRLDAFIYGQDGGQGAKFDIETGIRVCRAAGYHQHSLYLAQVHGLHDWYLRITLDDARDYDSALQHLSTLPFSEVETYLQRYGNTLVEARPGPTTALLLRLCTGYVPDDPPRSRSTTASSSRSRTDPVQDSHSGASLGSTHRHEGGRNSASSTAQIQQLPPMPQRGRAEEYIHVYAKQRPWLLAFLEQMAAQRPAPAPAVFNTLLELYLDPSLGPAPGVDPTNVSTEQLQASRRDKVMQLLQNPEATYSGDQAMVLLQLQGHVGGVVYLYEKGRLYGHIVQYYMEREDYASVMQRCQQYGQQEPGLWVMVLLYFAALGRTCRRELAEVLVNIERHHLLPPLLVVELLSKNGSVTLGVVRDYLRRCLHTASRDIVEDERLMRQYREETARMRQQIEDLRTRPTIVQAARCMACARPLELPTAHYLCGHSYHTVCLGDDKDCPVCQPEAQKVADMLQAQERAARDHDKFFKQLEGATDGFGVVAEYFGKGLFSRLALVAPP